MEAGSVPTSPRKYDHLREHSIGRPEVLFQSITHMAPAAAVAWLHGVFPVLGAVAFAFALYYQYNLLPDYPLRYANWLAIGWLVLGASVMIYLERTRPEAMRSAERNFVDDEAAAPAPAAR